MAALAVSCQAKEVIQDSIDMAVAVDFESTKTSVGQLTDGKFPLFWSETGEQARLYERKDGTAWSSKNVSKTFAADKDLKKGYFTFKLATSYMSKYDYYVLYPADRGVQITTGDYKNIVQFGVTGKQKPQADGPDPAYTIMLGKSEGHTSQPASISVDFEPAVAYGRMTVKNLSLASEETLTSMNITFPEGSGIISLINYYIPDGTFSCNQGKSTVDMIELDATNLTAGEEDFPVWFSLVESTIPAGSSIQVLINTSKGRSICKKFTLPEGTDLEFKRGRVFGFAIDMSKGTSSGIEVQAKDTPTGTYSAYLARTLSDLPGYTPSGAPETDDYGGWTKYSYEATGWFRVQKVNGRWWLITPQGHPFISSAVSDFSPGGSDRSKEVFEEKFGSNLEWARSEIKFLMENGFNSLGVWCSASTVRNVSPKIPYCMYYKPMLTFTRHLKNDLKWNIPDALPVVFSEEFDDYIKSETSYYSTYVNDRYCIGYVMDNELFWTPDVLKIYLDRLPAGDINRTTAQAWFDERKGKTGAKSSEITDEDAKAFRAYCLDHYLNRVCSYFKPKDKNHLFLGNKFYSWTNELVDEEMMKVAGKYFDVVTINHYRKWEPDLNDFARWESWTGKPMMITEFYVKGEDSGLANTAGAGWVVPTQTDRGLFYQNFIMKLIESGNCVGWQWFTYQDNDPQDKTADPSNTNANKGLVTWDYERYDDLLNIMSPVNHEIYNLAEYFDGKK